MMFVVLSLFYCSVYCPCCTVLVVLSFVIYFARIFFPLSLRPHVTHASYRALTTRLLTSLSQVSSQQGSLTHHRWLHNQFPPFFSVLHCLLVLDELQACPFPNVVFPPLPLSASSSYFGQTPMNGRYVHTTTLCVSLRWVGLRVVRLPAGFWHGLPPRCLLTFHYPLTD